MNVYTFIHACICNCVYPYKFNITKVTMTTMTTMVTIATMMLDISIISLSYASKNDGSLFTAPW